MAHVLLFFPDMNAPSGFLAQVANDLTLLVARLLNNGVTPAWALNPQFQELTTAHFVTTAFVVALILLLLSLLRWVVCRVILKRSGGSRSNAWYWLTAIVRGPLALLLTVFGIYFALAPILVVGRPQTWTSTAVGKFFDAGLFAVVVWGFILVTRIFEKQISIWTRRTHTKVDDLLLPPLIRAARYLIPAIAVILALPLMNIPARFDDVARKGTSILIIGIISWAFWRAVGIGENLTLKYYDLTTRDDWRSRKILTQIRVLKKVVLFFIGLFALASILMLFQEVRQLGTSLLASAGVVGIIIGVASQRTIANVFAGFQIAITQPIRIGDGVKVEGEFGWIEEITLTYVVVKLWDLRRLIVPINQFIEKPFQNWTRTSSAILGTAFLYLDYTAPLDPIRNEFIRIVGASPNWDKKVCVMHVTDASDHALQIRLLVSAANSGANFELRCEVREKLLAFIREHAPESLPRTRTFVATGRPESEFDEKEHYLPPNLVEPTHT